MVNGGEHESAGEALGGIRRGRHDRPSVTSGGGGVEEGALGRAKKALICGLVPCFVDGLTSLRPLPSTLSA